MDNIFFFQTQTISEDSNLFHQLKKQNISYSYFQAHQNYYLFFYAQQPIQLDFIYQSLDLIQELDFKQRKIRSFRGFFLYALEIIQTAKDYQILQTNLQPFFWKKVHNIIRQNKKAALQEFLFVKDIDTKYNTTGSSLSLQKLQNQVDSLTQQVEKLQQKVIQLETRVQHNSKDLFSQPSQPLETSKTIQHKDYTFEAQKGLYLTENQIKNPTYHTKDIESKTVSYDPKIDFKASDTTQQYNLPLNQEKELNQHNFITLSNLSENDKIQIIKTGFQLQAEGKISLKKYYQSTDTYSLFQLKGYSIKYESIRRTKFYQTLKE